MSPSRASQSHGKPLNRVLLLILLAAFGLSVLFIGRSQLQAEGATTRPKNLYADDGLPKFRSFTQTARIPLAGNVIDLLSADLNNDNYNDIIALLDNNSIHIERRSNLTPTVRVTQTFALSGTLVGGTSIERWSGGEHLIAVITTNPDRLILIANQLGIIEIIRDYPLSHPPGQVAAGRLKGSSEFDLMILSADGTTLTSYTQLGAYGVSLDRNTTIPAATDAKLLLTDLVGASLDDVVLWHRPTSGSHSLSVYRNDGTELEHQVTAPIACQMSAVTAENWTNYLFTMQNNCGATWGMRVLDYDTHGAYFNDVYNKSWLERPYPTRDAVLYNYNNNGTPDLFTVDEQALRFANVHSNIFQFDTVPIELDAGLADHINLAELTGDAYVDVAIASADDNAYYLLTNVPKTQQLSVEITAQTYLTSPTGSSSTLYDGWLIPGHSSIISVTIESHNGDLNAAPTLSAKTMPPGMEFDPLLSTFGYYPAKYRSVAFVPRNVPQGEFTIELEVELESGSQIVSKTVNIGANQIHLPLGMSNYCMKQYNDFFDHPTSGWPVVNNSRYSMNYVDGEYQIQFFRTVSLLYITGERTFDFQQMGIDTRASSSLVRWGLVYAYPADGSRFYLFEVAPYFNVIALWHYDTTNGFSLQETYEIGTIDHQIYHQAVVNTEHLVFDGLPRMSSNYWAHPFEYSGFLFLAQEANTTLVLDNYQYHKFMCHGNSTARTESTGEQIRPNLPRTSFDPPATGELTEQLIELPAFELPDLQSAMEALEQP